MSSSVIPESAVSFSPSLAAAIGLEEAILLQSLQRYAALANAMKKINPDAWALCSLQLLEGQLPFWTCAAIRRVLLSLVELGMVSLDKVPNDEAQGFSFTLEHSDRLSGTAASEVQPGAAAGLGGTRIPANWTAADSLLDQIQSLGIPREFALAEIPEFRLYWRERNEVSHSWSSRFLQHVNRRYQKRLQEEGEQKARLPGRAKPAADIGKDWQPSEDALDILARIGINRNFIEDSVPEFVLHWREAGAEQKTWNSKFVSHIKRQWARYTHAMANETEPEPIGEKWQPDKKVYEVLALANIDEDFARQLVPEFVMYWSDRNELHHSWNTRFLQYVKNQWARHYGVRVNGEAGQIPAGKRKTRDRTIVEDLSDRSWAEQAKSRG